MDIKEIAVENIKAYAKNVKNTMKLRLNRLPTALRNLALDSLWLLLRTSA